MHESIGRGWPESLSLAVGGAVVIALLGLLLLTRAMTQSVTAEESLHVAAAATLAEHGQLPVRDYPFVETPAMAALLAPLFAVASDRLLPARLLSVAAATIVGLLLLQLGSRRLDGVSVLARLAWGVGSVALLATCPFYWSHVGRALPMDPAAAAAVGAVLCALAACRTARRPVAVAWSIGAGLLAGAAAVLQLAYVPLLALPPALALTPAMAPRRRVVVLLAAAAAAAAPLVPVAMLYRGKAELLQQVLRDWPMLAAAVGAPASRPIWSAPAIGAVVTDLIVQPMTLVLLMACVGLVGLAGWCIVRHPRRPATDVFELVLVVAATAAVAAMVLGVRGTSASRLLAALPLAVVTCVLAASYARHWGGDRARLVASTIFVGSTLALLVPGLQVWVSTLSGFDRSATAIARHHAAAQTLQRTVLAGHVLTFEPLLPIEAGLDVYPTLICGETTWQLARSMRPDQRQRLNLVTPAQLEAMVRIHRPSAVLVSPRPSRSESPLVSYARHHQFEPHTLPTGQALWAPAAPPPQTGWILPQAGVTLSR